MVVLRELTATIIWILDFRFWILDLLSRLRARFFIDKVFAYESMQSITHKYINKTNPKSKI